MTIGNRVLLAGDASARPQGLERALTRAGFTVTESPPGNEDREPDAILVTLAAVGDLETRAPRESGGADSPPVVVLIAAPDPDAPAAALTLGADDALVAPIHLPELCARLQARIRDRQCPRSTIREGAVRRSLEGLVAEGRMTLRPDEVVLALVRRLARAFDLLSCAFAVMEPGAECARVVAEVGPGSVAAGDDSLLNPVEHPEVSEAIRSRRTISGPGGSAIAIPAVSGGRVHGVLLVRRRPEHPGLSPAQLQFAETLAEAAAKALEPARCEGHGNGNGNGASRPASAVADDSLDLRLQEEFERARRYSLSFSLVLLDMGSPGAEPGGVAEQLRRKLRLPDFVSRYVGGEVAIVLPETDVDGARRSVARMREQLGAPPPGSTAGDAPFSAGIVTYPHPAVTQADDMFALVEAALARGKAQAGERVGVAD